MAAPQGATWEECPGGSSTKQGGAVRERTCRQVPVLGVSWSTQAKA